MRKVVGIALPILLVLVFVTGIIESQPFHPETPELHVFLSVLLLLSSGIHLWLNRKAFFRYFTGPRTPARKNDAGKIPSA